MSKPRYGWWPYVKSMIRRYPALKEQHDNMLRMQITPSYPGMTGGGGDGRGLENTVIRAMSQNSVRELDAVEAALAETERLMDNKARMTMIDLVFWKRTHTLDGVALTVHYSPRTVKQWHGDFIRCVAKHYGLMD